MRRWLILCLLAACERAGDSQNPIGTGVEIATGPTGPRAIVDASVATLPNDAAPVVADAAVARTDARRRVDVVAMDEAAMRRFADQLTAVSPRDVGEGDMSKRRPGADLGRDIDAMRGGGGSVGRAGRGTRGDGDPRVGVGTGNVGTGGGAKIDSTGEKSAPSSGRVSVSSKRAVDDTSLTADMVVRKISAAYMAGIKRCYKQYLDQDSSARGRVTLAFRVSDAGRAENSRATGFSKEVDDCIGGQMASWRFPIPKDKADNATTASFEIALQLVPS